MKTIGKPGKAIIDGQKLKAAREAKGLSVTAMAASLTLSRAQVLQIEQGGEKAFYNGRHKMLAIRKYASALAIPFEEVVADIQGDTATEPVDESPQTIAQPVPAPPTAATPLPLAGVEYNEALRRRILMVIGVSCVIISLYVIGRISKDGAPAQQGPDSEAQARGTSSGATPETFAKGIAVPAPKMTQGDQTAVQLASQVSGVEDTESETSKIARDLCQLEQAVNALQTWSPSYQRKPGTRLYITSSQSSVICITDATGKSQLLDLKPMTGQAFNGKPPYTVRSTHLAQIEIYMQGMRVKIPNETEVMKLIPNQNTTPLSSQNNEIQAVIFNP